MHYTLVKNAFSQDLLIDIYNYYNNHFHEAHITNSMYKIENPWNLDIVQKKIKPILAKYFDTNLKNLGDNIYKHSDPYFPHCDTSQTYPCFNVLIPIKVENDLEQKFCIFDQYINDFSSGVTWVGKWFSVMQEFERNKKREFIYNDLIVENSTNTDIDNDFYIQNLEHKARDKSLFKGCSGVALDFKPGNLIIFDSKHIHCTGKMRCNWKMGLSLRFRGNFKDEIKQFD